MEEDFKLMESNGSVVSSRLSTPRAKSYGDFGDRVKLPMGLAVNS